MDAVELQKIKDTFALGCFGWSLGQTQPKAPYLSDRFHKEYVVKPGETLVTIANDLVNNTGNKYPDTALKFKNYKKETTKALWEFLATYNYGTSKPNSLNWLFCESHGFNKNVNLSSDKKNYMFKGGEKLFYPVMQPLPSGMNQTVGVASDDVPGYILFPSFATPSIVDTHGKLYLLIMSNPEIMSLTKSIINRKLKIISWKNPGGLSVCEIKNYSFSNPGQPAALGGYDKYKQLLFNKQSDAENAITCEQIAINEYIENPGEKAFAFVLNPALMSDLKERKFETLNLVTINMNALNLEEGFFNIFWINKKHEEEDSIIQERLAGNKDKNIVFLGDSIKKVFNGKYYGWNIPENTFYLENISNSLPIASYHPLLVTNKKYCNIAHLGDLHSVSRLSLLKLSTAKVIEHEDIEPIGKLINDYVSNVKNMFSQAGNNNEIDVVLISGDLIDFNRNFYPIDLFKKREELLSQDKKNEAENLTALEFYNTPGRIWNAVGVSNKEETKKKYQPGVDLISLYSIILDFYQKYHKPVYIVTGNHDAYEWPYGVSPRVLGVKANEGIPADGNMTFYEAILSYGKTYGDVLDKLNNFKSEHMNHFYELFTPMRDFSIIMKDWTLTGLGWGEKEKNIDWSKIAEKIPVLHINTPYTNDQEFGHLPRANAAITQNQKKILDFGVSAINRKRILFSHFTFVSFDGSIPSENRPTQQINYDSFFGKGDMGTFELLRENVYKDYMVDNVKLHYVLSGHSHRHGLYEIKAKDNNNATVTMYDFSDHEKVKGTKIIVSDSAGPIPKYNGNWELGGFGSCKPSFTMLTFKNDGEIDKLKLIPSTNENAKPRLAVALDYMYNQGKIDFFRTFKSKSCSQNDFKTSTTIDFEIELSEKLFASDIRLQKISFYLASGKIFKAFNLKIGKAIVKIDPKSIKYLCYPISFGEGENEKTILLFKQWFSRFTLTDTAFLSCTFSSNSKALQEYNYDSPYNFHVYLDTNYYFNNLHLDCSRNKNLSEIPDFEWRKQQFPEKYN